MNRCAIQPVLRLQLYTAAGDFSFSSLLFQVNPAGSSSVNAAGRNAVVTSLMICCGFVACWTMAEIFFFVNTIHHVIDFSGWLYHFSVVLVFANSCINPFIYAAKYREFQTAVKRMVGKQVESEATGSVTAGTHALSQRSGPRSTGGTKTLPQVH